MTGRKAIGLAVGALALGCFSNLSSASAQGQGPFTIRRPSDGATVREKQRIEFPPGSVKPGGFVAFYLDGKFYVALAPEDEEGGADKPFAFVWDTKGTGVSDGEHTLRAVLYEPAGNTSGVAVSEAGHSEVRLTVANKIKDGPESILLRYRYREGSNLIYSRDGKAIVVSSGSQNNKFNDEELSSVKSTLQLEVEDVRFDQEAQASIALVRNKLTSLSILDGSQERVLDRSQLSSSMYQELLTDGTVKYETGERSGSEYTALGLPINNTLELPLLPTLSKKIGDTWKTFNQRLDIPGLSPAEQPKVPLDNELVGLEYESGYKTAKIHQSYTGPVVLPRGAKTLQFGPVEVMSPRVKFERDIYISYESNLLIKTNRTLTVSGTTTSPIGAPPDNGAVGGGGGGRSFGGGGSPFGGGPGGGGAPGFGGLTPVQAGSGISGGAGGYPGGYPGGGGQGRRQSGGPGGPGGGPGGYPGGGQGRRQSGGPGGLTPVQAGAGISGGQNAGPKPGGLILGAPGGGQSGSGFAGSGAAQTDVPHAITLRSITDTSILPSSSVVTDEGPKSNVKTVVKPAGASKRNTTHKRGKGH